MMSKMWRQCFSCQVGQLLLFLLLNFACKSLGDNPIKFNDTAGLGRKLDGIGALSGRGTSRLLIDYPSQQRDEILDYLFKPNFGASLQMLKVEIGGDVQSGFGSEPSHMHYPWDENYQRGYEWWLMSEARKRNPNIALYAMPWGYPVWVGGDTSWEYHNIPVTANYIIRWIHGAKYYHNVTIDYLGLIQQREKTGYPFGSYDYIINMRQFLDEAGLNKVQIVAADEINNWTIAHQVLKNSSVSHSLYAIGSQFPGTKSSSDAQKTGKPLWSSEDFATKNDQSGGGCWAKTLNRNYVNGFMTSTISSTLISSHYKGQLDYNTGLMTAAEPTSGHYSVETPIWLTAHTTQFTSVGWTYLKQGSGVGTLSFGGSYVSLTSPDKTELTIVFETMTRHHSKCRYPGDETKSEGNSLLIDMVLGGSFAKIAEMNSWYSRLNFTGKDPTPIMFEKAPPVKFHLGAASITMGPDEVLTLTTLPGGNKGSHPTPPPSKPFPLPYTDDFEGYNGTEPRYLAQQTGVFQVMGDKKNKFLQQMVTEMPIYYCAPFLKSLSVIGDYSWSDVLVEVDFEYPSSNKTLEYYIAARMNGAGCQYGDMFGIYFFITANQRYYVCTSFLRIHVIKEGIALGYFFTGWHRLSLMVKGDMAVGAIDGKGLFNVTIPKTDPRPPTHGLVGLGSGFGFGKFDNLSITTAENGARIMDQYFSHHDNP